MISLNMENIELNSLLSLYKIACNIILIYSTYDVASIIELTLLRVFSRVAPIMVWLKSPQQYLSLRSLYSPN